ncbi:flavin reductase [Cloacibacterium rupense]|uniref:Flavin reductase n=1 Tax=Cloacibacterium rupense TaxID=517423 RepID=A0ABQ2NNN7_9FLAO|nr:flavin reductase family protein [Cloacibacterium rupense]GGP06514.1 flavin reductase [Cloacibacterium rupense]
MKQILPKDITPFELQSVLQHSVAPRPIALASTIDKDGNVNVSPFSFFNMFSTNPPILIFSPSRRVRGNTIKHTLENVLEIPEVVIGNVNFDMVQQVSLSSTEYEKGVNEFVKSGLTMKPADLVKPPLIAESPVNFECKVLEIKTLGTEAGAGNLVICEVLKIHIQEQFLDENGNLDQKKLNLVSRLGANWYGKTSEETLFEVPKPLQNKGIGYDQLPTEIKNSKIFTGNDLGMLANVEVLPAGSFYSEESKHLEAQQFLLQSKIEEAWKVLTL